MANPNLPGGPRVAAIPQAPPLAGPQIDFSGIGRRVFSFVRNTAPSALGTAIGALTFSLKPSTLGDGGFTGGLGPVSAHFIDWYASTLPQSWQFPVMTPVGVRPLYEFPGGDTFLRMSPSHIIEAPALSHMPTIGEPWSPDLRVMDQFRYARSLPVFEMPEFKIGPLFHDMSLDKRDLSLLIQTSPQFAPSATMWYEWQDAASDLDDALSDAQIWEAQYFALRLEIAAQQPQSYDYQYWNGSQFVTDWNAYWRDYNAWQSAWTNIEVQYAQAVNVVNTSLDNIAEHEAELERLADLARRAAGLNVAAQIRQPTARYRPSWTPSPPRIKRRDAKWKNLKGKRGILFAFRVLGKVFQAFTVWDVVMLLAATSRISPNTRDVRALFQDVWSNRELTREQKVMATLNIASKDWDTNWSRFLELTASYVMFQTLGMLEGKAMANLGRKIAHNPALSGLETANRWEWGGRQADQRQETLRELQELIGYTQED